MPRPVPETAPDPGSATASTARRDAVPNYSTPAVPEPRLSARARRVLAVAAVVALLAAVVAALTTEALVPRLLLDPGPIVRWGALVVVVVRDATLALTIGGLALLAFALPPPARVLATRVATVTVPPAPDARQGIAPRFQLTHRPHHRRARASGDGRAWERARVLTAVTAILWAVSQLVDVVLTHLDVSGTALSDPTYGAQLWQFVTELDLGRNLALAALFAAIATIAVVAIGSLTGAGWALGLTAFAVIPLALTGHASGAADHNFAVSGQYLHLIGLGLWVGGLVVLVALAPVLGRDLPDTARRFSVIAGWAVVFVLVSGIAASWIRLTTPLELFTHPYGRLLLVKILLTIGLGVAGWRHRTTILPRLDDAATARGAFRRLVAGESVVIAAILGVGVALAASAPPIPQEALDAPSTVFLLSQYPEPPYPSVANFLTQWQLDPLISLVVIGAALLYVRWSRRLAVRGDRWSGLRTASWLVGLAMLFYTTQGGPAVYGRVLFSVHMSEHMLLAMIIPILLVLGAPVTLAVRALPARHDGSRGGREWLLALVGSRWAQFFAHPIVAAINFSGSLWLFYYTGLFHLALTTHPGHLAMILHFTLAGYLFANAIIGIDPGPSRPPHLLRLVLLLATMAAHAFFGVSVFSATTLLAPDYFGWLGLSWGVDALLDQEAGGMITWGVGELPTLAMAVGVVAVWIKDDARAARRYDRAAERDHDAELEAYNAMLAARAEHAGTSGDGPRSRR